MSKKTRKRPVYAKLRQADWLIWRMVSEQKCCFCDVELFHGYDAKTLNNITLHHIEGDKTTDNYKKLAPLDKLLYAHSSCHKAYHMLERLAGQGKNIDMGRYRKMMSICAKHRTKCSHDK